MAHRRNAHSWRSEAPGLMKGVLAQLYFPDRDRRSATNGLAAYIARCRPLADALAEAGYHRCQRRLTPQQVALIYEYLGEPS